MAACTRGTLCRMARHARLCGSRNRTLASVKDGSIQSLPYFQNVDRQGDEAWDSFVARAAAETLAYLKAFTPKFIEEGDVYVDVTWVSEAEFRNLRA